MDVIIPRFKTPVDAAYHAEEKNLINFSIEKAEDGMFVIFLLDDCRKIPYTVDIRKETT